MEKAEENSATTVSNEMTSKMVRKNLNSPDEIISSEKEKIELVNLDGFSITRVTVEQGWSLDKDTDLKRSQAVWLDGISHTVENIGTENAGRVTVELKIDEDII